MSDPSADECVQQEEVESGAARSRPAGKATQSRAVHGIIRCVLVQRLAQQRQWRSRAAQEADANNAPPCPNNSLVPRGQQGDINKADKATSTRRRQQDEVNRASQRRIAKAAQLKAAEAEHGDAAMGSRDWAGRRSEGQSGPVRQQGFAEARHDSAASGSRGQAGNRCKAQPRLATRGAERVSRGGAGRRSEGQSRGSRGGARRRSEATTPDRGMRLGVGEARLAGEATQLRGRQGSQGVAVEAEEAVLLRRGDEVRA